MKKLLFILLAGICFSVNAQEDGVAPVWDVTRPNPKTTPQMNSMTRMVEGSEIWNSDTSTLWRYVGSTWVDQVVSSYDDTAIQSEVDLNTAKVTNTDDQNASEVTLDDTNLIVAPYTNLQTFADGVDHALLKARGTGVHTSYVSTVAVGGSTFAQPEVFGEISSDQGYFDIHYTGATGITVTDLSAASTYVYVDNAGNLQQQITTPTRQDWSRKIFTMRIAVNTSTNQILGFEYLNNPIGHYSNSIRDVYSYLLAQGIPFRKDQVITGRADLGFDVSAGTLMEFGGTGDIDNANIRDIAAVTNAQFFLATKTTFDAGGNTDLPKVWDNNDVLTALGSTTFVGHRLYRFSNGNFAMQYGQGNYANIDLATVGIKTEEYVLNPALKNATLFGWWLIEDTATNTSGTSKTAFVEYTIGIQGGVSNALSGAALKGNNASDFLDASAVRTNIGINTTANQTDSTDKRFVTDAEKVDIADGDDNTDEQTAIQVPFTPYFTLNQTDVQSAMEWIWAQKYDDVVVAGNGDLQFNANGTLRSTIGKSSFDNQSVSLSGNTLNITNGTGVDLSPILNTSALTVAQTTQLTNAAKDFIATTYASDKTLTPSDRVIESTGSNIGRKRIALATTEVTFTLDNSYAIDDIQRFKTLGSGVINIIPDTGVTIAYAGKTTLPGVSMTGVGTLGYLYKESSNNYRFYCETITGYSASTIPTSVNQSSLQSYYDANSNTGIADGSAVTTIEDDKNSNNAIALNNIVMNIAADGVREWQFNGTDSFINLGQQSGNSFTSSNSFTIMVQVGESNPNQAGTIFIKGGNNQGVNRAFHMIKPSTGSSHWIGGFGTGASRTLGSSNADNQEQLLFLTWNGTSFSAYRNGTLSGASLTPGGTPSSVAMDLIIGGQRSTTTVDNTAAIGTEMYQGTIRKFATFNAVLTPTEMQAIATEIAGN
jgi:hypothetical protein